MHPLFVQYQSTVLGRIKTRLLTQLSGSDERLPSQRIFFKEVFKRWKSNPSAGRFYFHLLNSTRIERFDFSSPVSKQIVEATLTRLNREEFFPIICAEGPMEVGAQAPHCLSLALGHLRPCGRPGYYVTIYPDGDGERGWCCSLLPDNDHEPGEIALMGENGWETIPPSDVGKCLPARTALITFQKHLDGIEPSTVSLAKIQEIKWLRPPDDFELIRRLESVMKGEMRVSSAITPFSLVIPYSLDFCLSIPPSALDHLTVRIRSGYRPLIAVYWSGEAFVMNDDYIDFLAYKKAGCDEIPIAVLGDFPDDRATVIKRGGSELLPPIGLARTAEYPKPVGQEFKAWQLDEAVHESSQPSLPSHLIAVWMAFAELLSDEELDERSLHEFLFKHPEVLTAYGKRIESEVRLGQTYRIDLVVHSSGVRDEVTLVELEHHRHQIFTGSGQTRSEITHAIQQVQDWYRWLRENPTDGFSSSLNGVPPKGMVVAGRSRFFDEDHRSRLAHLNSTSPVQVITYDELLDRFADLILSRLDAGEE